MLISELETYLESCIKSNQEEMLKDVEINGALFSASYLQYHGAVWAYRNLLNYIRECKEDADK